MASVICAILASLLSLAASAGDYTNYVRLFSFGRTNGANPQAELIEGTDGRLFGTTPEGGLTSEDFPDGAGVVFSLKKDGTDYKVLHYFGDAGDGQHPSGGLVEGKRGTLFGTTREGGTAAK